MNTLDVQGLIDALIQAQEASTNTDNPEQARQVYATLMAQAIHQFVLTGTVVTVGSATTQTGSMS